jgi:hypothetical protein
MSTKVQPIRPPARNIEHYFGACPDCGATNGYINVGGQHWFVCRPHKTRWWAGYNLFSSWQDEGEAVWRRNADLLATYREVEPLPMEVAADGEG